MCERNMWTATMEDQRQRRTSIEANHLGQQRQRLNQIWMRQREPAEAVPPNMVITNQPLNIRARDQGP
jgi:hypothetical protein